MESVNNTSAQNTPQGRTIYARQVSQRLRAAIIPDLGPNKLTLVGNGRPFERPETKRRIRIYNVQAFADQLSADKAADLFMKGLALERDGKVLTEECQNFYKQAYNLLMNFSVLEENAYKFDNCLEVQCKVEWGQTKAGAKVLQLNSVQPVKTETSGKTMGSKFDLPEDMLNTQQPATATAATAMPDLTKLMSEAGDPTADQQAQTELVTAGAGEPSQAAQSQSPAAKLNDIGDANIPDKDEDPF